MEEIDKVQKEITLLENRIIVLKGYISHLQEQNPPKQEELIEKNE